MPNFPQNPYVGQTVIWQGQEYRWNGGQWVDLTLPDPAIVPVYVSASEPQVPIIEGSLWFNTIDNSLKVWVETLSGSSWRPITGSSSSLNPTVKISVSPPPDAKVGDLWFDTNSGFFNLKFGEGGTEWISPTQGPPGPPGPPGIGSEWHQGAGVPGSGIGSIGDFYVNSINADVYGPKSSTGWGQAVFNLTGPTGVVAASAPLSYNAIAKSLSIAIGSSAGTVAAGNDARFNALSTRLDQFRDARTFYVSKRIGASDSNNGNSPGEPFLTIGAAVAAANAYRVANPNEFAAIEIGPGTYVETALPMRLRSNVLVRSLKQRTVRIKPATGQELNSFFAVDSGCMLADLTFAGHQAANTSPTDSTVGTRAWAVQFNEQANGGQGVFLTASPYIKDCLSLTAEDDNGEAGSISTGDCGGGVEVDGAKCHPNSPIRSMVVYGFTQQNLGGPGAIIKNDAYAELVSFFGLFGTWHVRCETGGQATMSGGGCSEFGTYGLMADGFSPTPIFTGSLRIAASTGALLVDVISMSANRLGSSSRPAAGQIMLIGGTGYVIQSSTPITSAGVVVTDTSPLKAGYRIAFFNPSGTGLVASAAQGAAVDFRLRSQISAGCHSANYVGSGTNYSALPWNGGVPIRANETVETNFGRIFGLVINDVGDVRVAGGAFSIDGTTGAVTINTSQFNLSGLNAIGPFSRNGGLSTVGVQLQEVSNNAALLASTGIAESDTVPTQYAVKSYLEANYSKVFQFEQAAPASTWTINHNLGFRPSVEILDSGSQEIDGEISHPTVNQTVIQLKPATAGLARLS